MTKAKINKNKLIPTNYWSHQGQGVATPTRKVEDPNHPTSSLPEQHRCNCYAETRPELGATSTPRSGLALWATWDVAPRVVQPGKGLEDPPALMSPRNTEGSSSPLPVLPHSQESPEDVEVLRPPPGRPMAQVLMGGGRGPADGWAMSA